MEIKVSRSPEEEVIAALSVFVVAFNEFNGLLDKRIEKISEAIYKSPSFNNPSGSNRGYRKDKNAETIASIKKIDERLKELSENFVKLYHEVKEIIDNNIDNYNQKSILEWRYINGKKWPEISKKTGFEVSYCRRLHRNAISILVKKGISTNEKGDGCKDD